MVIWWMVGGWVEELRKAMYSCERSVDQAQRRCVIQANSSDGNCVTRMVIAEKCPVHCSVKGVAPAGVLSCLQVAIRRLFLESLVL